MNGTVLGNVLAIVYFTMFQIGGMALAFSLLKNERTGVKIFFGSVMGSFAVHWLPTMTSMVMQFTVASHIAALVLFAILVVGVVYVQLVRTRQTVEGTKKSEEKKGGELVEVTAVMQECWILIPMVMMTVLFAALLRTHTILEVDGALHSGQSTYGDMNMHLGFITSIAKQGTFPPEYSILPGAKLCYPFLSDSISSSLYVFGSSLVMAYILPMLVAFAQVMGGIYLFAERWLKSKLKAFIVWLLFLFSGGFGMYYFTGLAGEGQLSMQELMEGFYRTPTNLTDHNVRWVNTICDMLIPQRASLFGWAMLFPVLYLLYRATFEKQKKYYLYAAIIAGGLPMIHTHSFLALGITCAAWLFMGLLKKRCDDEPNYYVNKYGKRIRQIGLLVVIHGFSLLASYKRDTGAVNGDLMLAIFLIGMMVFVVYLGVLIHVDYQAGGWKQLLRTWGLFLAVVLVLALPQLFTWTFQQATGDSFVRGHFNWSNDLHESYALFYLKNLGVVAILSVIAFLTCSKEKFRVAAPAVMIWLISEVVVFQPNTYDNNKLLFVGYVFALCLSADVLVDGLRNGYKKWFAKHLEFGKVAAAVVLAFVLGLGCVSGGFSIAREYVSDYELYSKGYTEAAAFVEEQVPVDATLLTANNHNNAIASLTGRDIVCGAGTFLYFHGLDYTARETAVKEMFARPAMNLDYFEMYEVDYVVIGSMERGLTEIDEAWFASNMTQVYANDEVTIYENTVTE